MLFAILLTFFSKRKTDFGFCTLMLFEISVPEGSAPVTSRPHRINPVLAEEVDATLNQYLAAGLIQHSTSPYSSPLVVIPKKSRGVQITVNYKKTQQDQQPQPAAHPARGPGSGLFGQGTGVFPGRSGFFVPSAYRA